MKLIKKTLCIMIAALLVICSCFSAASAEKKKAVTSVKLSKSSCSVNVNASVKLTASVSPSNATDKTIKWSSSNTKVARVNQSGVVEGVGAGTATITAKSSNGKKATCKVTVKAIAVTKISFNSSSVETIGKTKLNVTITPSNATNKSLTWSSSNTKIATVDKNGVVTPKGYGTATITVKSSNGKKASCKVTVKKDVKIQKSYVVAKENPYEAKDTIIIIVDGKTGKVVGTDCYQSKRDFTLIIGATVSGNGIKVYNKQENYADFRANWSVSISVGIWKLKLDAGSVVNRTNSYRLYNDGRLVILDASCSDLLGLCR